MLLEYSVLILIHWLAAYDLKKRKCACDDAMTKRFAFKYEFSLTHSHCVRIKVALIYKTSGYMIKFTVYNSPNELTTDGM